MTNIPKTNEEIYKQSHEKTATRAYPRTSSGARMEKEIIEMVEDTAQEEHIDKTKALKELIILGREQYLLQKHLQLYQQGKCSLDKAAKMVGLTVHEMMQEAAKAGIQSEQTIEEYRRGVQLLN